MDTEPDLESGQRELERVTPKENSNYGKNPNKKPVATVEPFIREYRITVLITSNGI